jgi:hypothetical protein
MKKIIALVFSTLFAAAFVQAPTSSVRALAIRLVVIVAKGSPVTDLSKSELKRLFLSESVMVSGTKLVPFNYNPGTPERTAFDRAVLGLTAEQVGRLWIDRRVRGQLPAPRSLPSAAYMNKVVEVFPNAIGYVPENQLSGSVRPVRVDGASHTDPSYDVHAP